MPRRRQTSPHRALLAVALAGALGLSTLSACASGPAAESSTSTGAHTPRAAAPVEPSTPTPTIDQRGSDIAARLDAMSLDARIRSLLMLHTPGTDPVALRAFMATTGAGGFIDMGDNVAGGADVLGATNDALVTDPTLPPLVAIDEEGGDVTRLPDDDAAGADELKSLPVDATSAAFARRAGLLKTAGVGINFGIVADTTADTGSFIFSRVLGTDPLSAGDRVDAAVSAESGTVMSTLKHFPGHGRAPGDSHISIPSTDASLAEWQDHDAIPFQRGIDAGAEAVMMGHLAFTAVDGAPASLSSTWNTILRDDLGFDGLIITDDMLMLQDSGDARYSDAGANAVAALAAGDTMLLYVLPADPASVGAAPDDIVGAITAAVGDGRLSETVIDDAAARVIGARLDLAGR